MCEETNIEVNATKNIQGARSLFHWDITASSPPASAVIQPELFEGGSASLSFHSGYLGPIRFSTYVIKKKAEKSSRTPESNKKPFI